MQAKPHSRFRCLPVHIPPHQQLFHEALFNKFDVRDSFSQKNNGRVNATATAAFSNRPLAYTGWY
jgi:hypothetical protein